MSKYKKCPEWFSVLGRCIDKIEDTHVNIRELAEEYGIPFYSIRSAFLRRGSTKLVVPKVFLKACVKEYENDYYAKEG